MSRLWTEVDNPRPQCNPQGVERIVYSCPQCDYPMVWNEALQGRWCAVYGRHLDPHAEPARNVMRRHLRAA